jgi:two-component system sensor histidine kinase KdpD
MDHMMVIFDPGVEHRIMVCVTPQKSCERLIQRGAARAKEKNGEFCVVYVNKRQHLNRDLKEHKILLELFELAKDHGGTVSILSGEKVYDTLAEFARNNRITHIIVGKSLRSAFEIQKSGEVINPLIKAVEKNGIVVEVVD